MKTTDDKILTLPDNIVVKTNTEGLTTWKSPSNIAFIKYWGKKPRQLPQNPSLSMTLKNSFTVTAIKYKYSDNPDISYFFERQAKPEFEHRIKKYLNSLHPFFPFLKNMELTIHSENTFPHSAGIASSASSFSALALCLCDIERQHYNTLYNEDDFYMKASYVARMGSGSACRSVFAPFAIWGKSQTETFSSDLYAARPTCQPDIFFNELQDAILLVSSDTKKTSSSAGHNMMENHIFAHSRYKQANDNFEQLLKAMCSRDLNTFSHILENEALSIHALMMTSKPPVILLDPNTLYIIEHIKKYRDQNNVFISFTIDAGPNVHLIYHINDKLQVVNFIENELTGLLEGKKWIDDGAGNRPEKTV